MTRKLKAHLFESILVLLNASLREDEDENIKKNSKKRIVTGPFFVKITQKIIRKTTVKHNQKLLSKQIKVEQISTSSMISTIIIQQPDCLLT